MGMKGHKPHQDQGIILGSDHQTQFNGPNPAPKIKNPYYLNLTRKCRGILVESRQAEFASRRPLAGSTLPRSPC